MNAVYKDKLIYIRNKINKAGVKNIALFITELIEKENAKKLRKKSF